MRPNIFLAVSFAALLALSACSDGADETETSSANTEATTANTAATDETVAETTSAAADETASAIAEISSTSDTDVQGEATFTQDTDGLVTMTVEISGAEAGTHGFHIHQGASCDDSGAAAGGHWDIDGSIHGEPGADPSQIGDTGNIEVAEDGSGTLEVSNEDWTLGDASETDVVDHAVILHELADTFKGETGEAGGRVACGVIS